MSTEVKTQDRQWCQPVAAGFGPWAGFSLRQTSAWVSLLEIADLSNPGVHYRLKQAVAFLAALVGRLLAGEIRIGDRNYARVPVLKRFLAAGGGKADFIVRVGWNALQLSNPRGKAFDLIGYLQRLPLGMKPHEVSLHATTGREEAALVLSLVVQRKTLEATEATRLALRRAAIKKGKKLDPRSLIAAAFMIVGTSLPRTGYTAKDILAVHRLRWQIELAFNRLKSLLNIDRLPTWTEPAGHRPRIGVMFVFAQVSSMKTRCFGSILPCRCCH